MPEFPFFDIPYRKVNDKSSQVLSDLPTFSNKKVGDKHKKGKSKWIKCIVFCIFYFKNHCKNSNDQGQHIKRCVKKIEEYFINQRVKPFYIQVFRSFHMEHLHKYTVIAFGVRVNINSFVTSVVRTYLISKPNNNNEIHSKEPEPFFINLLSIHLLNTEEQHIEDCNNIIWV